MAAVQTSYYLQTRLGGVLLRRSDEGDHLWAADHWEPTTYVNDYLLNGDMDTEDLTAAEASAQFPEAFA